VTQTRAMVRAADLGQMGRGVDTHFAVSRSGERGARGKHFRLPYFASERRAALRAEFEISGREIAPLAVLVRLARAENPVRQ
jgi:hypothetical protein